LGGVASYIQAERLRAARLALSDPADRRSVARIAESVGLFDTSSFSRMFRRAFGCSPQEMRMACLAGWSAPTIMRAPRAAAPQTITELLRQL
jgi:AraC-like DNA-binding protein